MYKCIFNYKYDVNRFGKHETTINHIPQIGEQIIHIDDRDLEVLYKVEHLLYFERDNVFEIYLTLTGYKDEILKDWN